jgi:HEAT repeat protein
VRTSAAFLGGAALLLAGALGCAQETAPADLSQTPWLDPKVQVEGLKSKEVRIRAASVINLGNIGADAAAAIPELEKVADADPEPKIRAKAVEALEKIKAAQ